jgi:hypothetical protein
VGWLMGVTDQLAVVLQMLAIASSSIHPPPPHTPLFVILGFCKKWGVVLPSWLNTAQLIIETRKSQVRTDGVLVLVLLAGPLPSCQKNPFLLQYSVFGPCRSPFAEMQEEGSNYPPRHEYSYISGILDNYISWGLSMRFSLLPHSLNVPGTSILTRLLYEYTYSYILEMSGSQPRIAKSPLNCNPGRRSLRFWKLGDDGRRISHHQLRGEHSLGGIGPWPLGGME